MSFSHVRLCHVIVSVLLIGQHFLMVTVILQLLRVV